MAPLVIVIDGPLEVEGLVLGTPFVSDLMSGFPATQPARSASAPKEVATRASPLWFR
jgi:hypothetical protein